VLLQPCPIYTAKPFRLLSSHEDKSFLFEVFEVGLCLLVYRMGIRRAFFKRRFGVAAGACTGNGCCDGFFVFGDGRQRPELLVHDEITGDEHSTMFVYKQRALRALRATGPWVLKPEALRQVIGPKVGV
jgi:hypothetical protein